MSNIFRKNVSTETAEPAAAPFVAPRVTVAGAANGQVLDGKVPEGDPAEAWHKRRDAYKLVGANNKRKFTVVVIGTGLAGSGCAAALAEQGYNVHSVTYHDAPRRAHSVAAQGGINAARARKVDGDSIYRFVKDTVKGGDSRSREAEAFRLGEESIRVNRPHERHWRTIRTRVWWHTRHPFVRRRSGVSYVLHARPDGPAAPDCWCAGSAASGKARDDHPSY